MNGALANLPDCVEAWLAASFRSKDTRRNYRRALRDLLRHMPLQGDPDDARLATPDDLLTITPGDMHLASVNYRERRPDISRKTWNVTICAWRTFNKWLHKEGRVEHLAALNIALRPDVHTPREAPTVDQVERIWRILLSRRVWRGSDMTTRAIIRRDRAMFALLVGSALRAAEIAQLDVGDFDCHERLVSIRNAKGDRAEKQPWPIESDRFILPCVADRAPSEIAFHGPLAGRMANKHLNAVIRRLCALARAFDSKGKPFTAHSFRHFAGTWVYEQTHDIHLTSIFLRHKHIETTRRYDTRLHQRRVTAPIHLPARRAAEG